MVIRVTDSKRCELNIQTRLSNMENARIAYVKLNSVEPVDDFK